MSEPLDAGLQWTQAWLDMLDIDGFNPVVSKNGRWVSWITNFGPGTCIECAVLNGRIFEKHYPPRRPPLHENCNCELQDMLAILAGTAIIDGPRGADYRILFFGVLPENYVPKDFAKIKGWINFKGNLRDVLPGATMCGDIFKNKNDILPTAPGRIWYEADINYTGGYRNTHRLLYSNDGLIFVIYDHYLTFYEVINIEQESSKNERIYG